MKTRLSTKGQLVLPRAIRRRMNLQAGDELETRMEAGSIVLTPKRKRTKRGRLMKDRRTGLLVLTAEKGAPPLTSAQVAEMLADFP